MGKFNEYYDKLSNRYDELYGDEQRLKHEKVLNIIGGMRFNAMVEIGCGSGELLSQICANGATVIGLDFSSRMLMQAKLRAHQNEQLILADACHLPLREDSIDCIVSISVADEQSALGIISEADRIGTRGASMIMSLLHPGMPAPKSLSPSPGGDNPKRQVLSDRETLYVWTKVVRAKACA